MQKKTQFNPNQFFEIGLMEGKKFKENIANSLEIGESTNMVRICSKTLSPRLNSQMGNGKMIVIIQDI